MPGEAAEGRGIDYSVGRASFNYGEGCASFGAALLVGCG
jgi:hypothetical protein